MAALTLLEPVDAVVCCLDSLNYVTRPRQVQRTFERAWQALAPGGLFVFDIRSPEMLRSMDGQICLDETEDTQTKGAEITKTVKEQKFTPKTSGLRSQS